MEKLKESTTSELRPLQMAEKKEINGGSIVGGLLKWFLAAYASHVLSEPEEHLDAFKKGYEAGLD